MAQKLDFRGFPEEAFAFYRQLAENNNREWFQAHKSDYEDYVLLPASAFVVALGSRLKERNGTIHYDPRTNGQGSIKRIYRDLRFSKDKTPYKTNLGIRFWQGVKGGSGPSPGYFMHLEVSGADLYSGIHGFPKPVLTAYRAAVDRESTGAQLEAVLSDLRGARYEVGGEMLKRVPREYDPDHARAPLLRYKSLHARGPHISPDVVTSSDLVATCLTQCETMAPLNDWLAALGP